MSQTQRAQAQPVMADLPRVLGASQATAIVVGTIIGSGIFLVPREMMQDVGSSALVYLAWIAGGLLSLFGAMTYAELGAMLPYAGGEYVYLRGAYGDTPAFLYMWTWFAVAKPASIAAITIGLARTLEFFPAFHVLTTQAIGGPLPLLWSQIFAIAATWFITGLNYLGIKKAGEFQLVFTVLKGILILIVAGLCFASATGTWSNFTTTVPHAVGGLAGFMAALIATLWAYDGWNDLTMVAGEIRRPERSLPIALIAGLLLVGVLFMATNAAIQYILPATQIAASERPAVAALSVVAGPAGAGLVAAAMALSIFVSLNGTIMARASLLPLPATGSSSASSRTSARASSRPQRRSPSRHCSPPYCCSSSASFSSTSNWRSLPNGSSICSRPLQSSSIAAAGLNWRVPTKSGATRYCQPSSSSAPPPCSSPASSAT
jgi:APA family basic amino acid/polyamine antiporter